MSDYFAPGDRVTVTWSGGAQETGVLERAESWTVTLPDGSCEVVEAAAVRRPAETGETEDALKAEGDSIDQEVAALRAAASPRPVPADTEGGVTRPRPAFRDPEARYDNHDEDGHGSDPAVGWDLAYGCQVSIGYQDGALRAVVAMSDGSGRGHEVRTVTEEQVRAYASHLMALVAPASGAAVPDGAPAETEDAWARFGEAGRQLADGLAAAGRRGEDPYRESKWLVESWNLPLVTDLDDLADMVWNQAEDRSGDGFVLRLARARHVTRSLRALARATPKKPQGEPFPWQHATPDEAAVPDGAPAGRLVDPLALPAPGTLIVGADGTRGLVVETSEPAIPRDVEWADARGDRGRWPARVLDVPGAPSPLAEAAGLLAEVAGLLGCTPDQVPARVRGLLDELEETRSRLAEAETHTSAFRDLTARSGAMRDEVEQLVTRYDELLAWGHELDTENRALSAMLRASARRTVSARRTARANAVPTVTAHPATDRPEGCQQ